MIISKRLLKKVGACQSGIDWVCETFPEVAAGKRADLFKVISTAIKAERFSDINWYICSVMNRENKIRYACYAAKLALPIYEKQFPTDKRPRNAINAAIKCIKKDTAENRAYSAYSAARAADAAADSAYSAARAAARADARAYSAYSAARAADSAAYSAYSAARAGARAAYSADSAAYSAYSAARADAAIFKKIVTYGVKLIKKQPSN